VLNGDFRKPGTKLFASQLKRASGVSAQKKGAPMTSEELKQAVGIAVKIGRDQLAARLQACAEGERSRCVSQMGLAVAIVDRVPALAKVAAQLGQGRVSIMALSSGDYDRPYSHRNEWEICLPAWLKGAARIVFDDCAAAGLSPKIEYWYDGEEKDSGYTIVIRLK
jgi:hypothetical protein